MPQPTVGDLFDLHGLVGRVMLNVHRQCVKPGHLRDGSPLFFFSSSLLIEIAEAHRVLVPGVWVETAALKKIAFSGTRAVDPDEVEFPVPLTIVNGKVAVVRGEVRVPLPIDASEYDALGTRESILGLYLIAAEAMRLAGREADMEAGLREEGRGELARSDLRFSPHRARIESLMPDAFATPYSVWARKRGADLARFYQ